MFLRLRLITLSLATSALLLIILCLGSQNLNNRISLKLGPRNTEPLPSGFLIGISLVLGFISGGASATLLINQQKIV